ncbi:conserved hypothetical protein [Cellulomonas flavigena DSM 20109]|uniref:Uncharacterized protein n=1 Tax=Cellulomonas flavigena (strain ATCC 482 / DSM 20109 / BCRC 11376 / JCM 18109 / NBRC 3775 / NCIMB 8073 / NRS 134) TaxID=446466 RepID=D5UK80_CELFN|nr:hypothetical protein [Cellulomonas flavigena]ADG75741.1 conserved hypothetical protein [Cellulomonas flavigena DSM 20109]
MTPSGPARVPGELVLHPVPLVALAVLLLNDHVLKAAAPGWVTGKLSDVAGLAFFPFLVLAARDVVMRRAPSLVPASVVAAVTALAFAALKLSATARDVYADVVGVLRFPVDALVGGAVAPVRVVVQPDATDVWTVVACAAVVLVVRGRPTGPTGPTGAVPGAHPPRPATMRA